MGFDVVESALGSIKNHRLFIELLDDMSDEDFNRFSRKMTELTSSVEEMKRYDVTYTQLGDAHVIVALFLSKRQRNKDMFNKCSLSLKENGIKLDYAYGEE